MKQKNNSLFGKKMSKTLQRFLTSESGRITKKDAFGVSAAGALLVGIEDVVAGHGSSYPTSTNPAGADPFPSNGDVNPNKTETNTWTIVNDATCNHASGLVNGHFSNIPSVNISSEQIDYTKSHNSHSSHGSGGWC